MYMCHKRIIVFVGSQTCSSSSIVQLLLCVSLPCWFFYLRSSLYPTKTYYSFFGCWLSWSSPVAYLCDDSQPMSDARRTASYSVCFGATWDCARHRSEALGFWKLVSQGEWKSLSVPSWVDSHSYSTLILFFLMFSDCSFVAQCTAGKTCIQH